MRHVTIYAIRDKSTLDVRYVGQTTSLRRRAQAGYHGALAEWLASVEWEYVTLEIVGLNQAQEAEQRHIERFRALGCELFNRNAAAKSPARAVAPSVSGTRWTEANFAAHGYVQVKFRLRKAELEELDALAAEWNCSRTEASRRAIREARNGGNPE